MKKLRLITILVIVMMIFVGCSSNSNNDSNVDNNDNAETEKNIKVDVVLADGTSKTFEITTTADNLGDALVEEKLVEGEDSQYGLYIKTVDGVTVDESKEEWWCLTKNGGETVNTGVDSTEISDGDKFELTLKVGY